MFVLAPLHLLLTDVVAGEIVDEFDSVLLIILASLNANPWPHTVNAISVLNT